MRIVHAADFHNSLAGSFIPAIAALARSRRARGDEFFLVVPRIPDAVWHDDALASGIELLVVDGDEGARRAVRTLGADLLHLHFYGWLLPVTLAEWRTRTTILWHIHSGDHRPQTLRNRVGAWLRFRLAGARARRILVVSGAVADQIKTVGAPARKVVVVPNAIDEHHFRPPTASERAEARASFGIPSDAPVVAFFGRDPIIKGTDRLVAAMRDIPEAILVAVGADDGALQDLQGRRVVSVRRVDDVRSVYWASDALAMPSRAEGMPYTLLEASATGLPAVTSAIAPLREAAATIPTITSVDADDPRAFASAIRRSLGSARSPADSIVRKHSLDRWVETVEAIYDEVCS
ncbi:MAG: glycosyltransferase family 4 protein [Candidatus Eremiobacteraeota bacterium]|nr:glycosyltransferase family 4 protein [Candidatus Eremiobacteraeota bacterium]